MVSRAHEALVVLAAGRGSRLGEHTRSTPKWLLPVAGRPIADYQIESFPAGVLEAFTARIVVAGFQQSAVRRYARNLQPSFEVLINPRWRQLNNWYSLLLALERLAAGGFEGSVVLLNGDLLFRPRSVETFFPAPSIIDADIDLLVDFDRPLTDEAMKVACRGVAGDRISGIGKVGIDAPVGEDIGMWRLSPRGWRRMRRTLHDFVGHAECANLWYQSALSRLISEDLVGGGVSSISTTPTGCSDWVEIDDEFDLAFAEQLVRHPTDATSSIATPSVGAGLSAGFELRY